MTSTTTAPTSATIRVAVLGADGRMGRTTCAAVEAADGLELVARVEQGDDVTAVLAAAGAQVAVDFTHPSATETNVHAALDAGAHVVVGTTGWTDESRGRVADHLARRADEGLDLGVIIAPNFGLSAVLAGVFAAQAARYFESVEVIELHHPDKADAPSGTATHTAHAVAAARRAAGVAPSPDATESGWEARGADVDGVRVHAVRLRGLVAHEEILLGNVGEQLVIRQDSFDRASFMPGVVLAVREVVGRPGLTVGLENVLDLG
ncbi:4-hydroxy-tetrahydrodipicolinate reductase [Luteimicrobium subarcticum]|uniref:4-hydroxy-tetrahydrodipicolinate reductase n=1 Tax=Luteimicrobium subarcticum TaxID=620910 RepID=A0A2M8WU63_9MICO|nr:4-hydroxy-tetrahydrodipicolinate reductase [Luteimicrobium subarcticum]PJI94396.1 dihydrodipicolinate reductase [Luteimicrobium subarcticum]